MEIVEKQCWSVFVNGDKDEAMRILPKLHTAHAIRGSLDRTLLHLAALHGWDEIFLLLLEEYHCDPKAADNLGQSPLHWACDRNNLSLIVLILSRASLRLNGEHKYGTTPFDYHTHDYATLS